MSYIAMLLQAATPSNSQSMLMSIAPFFLIIVVFYFFIIRPQNKKQKEMEKMLNAIKKGDVVVTIGGIHGVVVNVKEATKTVVLKVDDDTKIEFNRSAISSVVKSDTKVAKAAEKESKSAKVAKDAKADKDAKDGEVAAAKEDAPASATSADEKATKKEVK